MLKCALGYYNEERAYVVANDRRNGDNVEGVKGEYCVLF
jgi:hypothetical protein